jgi:carbamoyltransferase
MEQTSMKIVGFQSGHDVSYCILEDGVPVVHEELERIIRKKEPGGDGLEFFFNRNEEFDDVKHFAFGCFGSRSEYWSKRARFDPFKKEFDQKMKDVLDNSGGNYYELGHHLSHASNAYYTSQFDEALIITVDGGGTESPGNPTALTINYGIQNKINRLHIYPERQINLGGLWFKFTGEIFGLSTGYPIGNQAGSVMAMATMGNPKYLDLMHLNMAYDTRMSNFIKLKEIAQRSEQDSFDVAATLQRYTEDRFRDAIAPYMKTHMPKNVCFSGGVSLNCVMLGKIKEWFPCVQNIFCDPVPYDGGLSLGAARYVWHHILNNPKIKSMNNMTPYLGKKYSQQEIDLVVKKYENLGKIESSRSEDQDILDHLESQKIVAVFGGGSESGRRALGNRSILADPRSKKMKDMLNQRVKHRQWYRPFAPSILLEDTKEWFENSVYSPYMSFALKFKKDKIDKVPAVAHTDGTGRLQTVHSPLNPWYHAFLTKWKERTGVPILLNTSFNDREPIVETPEDAIKCFIGTDIDYLYFYESGTLVTKNNEEK